MRRKFLLGIFGALGLAKGQQWKACVPDKRFNFGGNAVVCTSENQPALNGQCPVCGTIAPSYKATVQHSIRPRLCGANEATTGTACFDAVEEQQPSTKLLRCQRCNAAFWQDAE